MTMTTTHKFPLQGWVPPTHVFPDMPPANTVYMTDAPPPYPGINGYNGYANGGAAAANVGGGGWSAAAGGAQPMSSADRKAAEAAQVGIEFQIISAVKRRKLKWRNNRRVICS